MCIDFVVILKICVKFLYPKPKIRLIQVWSRQMYVKSCINNVCIIKLAKYVIFGEIRAQRLLVTHRKFTPKDMDVSTVQ